MFIIDELMDWIREKRRGEWGKYDWMIITGVIFIVAWLTYSYLVGGWGMLLMNAVGVIFINVTVYFFGEWFPWPDPVRRYLFGDDDDPRVG